MQVGVHVLLVKSGGHLRDYAAYRTASSAESFRLSASALLAALHLGFIPRVDADICALVAGVCSAVASGHGFFKQKLRSAARARAAAKRLADANEGSGVLSTAQLLRQFSVAPTVREFETYGRNHKWKLKSGSAGDEVPVKYGAAMYELGEDAGPMRAALYGMALFRPDQQLPANSLLPKAARDLKGFFRLVPGKVRDSLPWLVVVLFSDYWLSQGPPFWAAAALLQFDTYLRPGEVLAHEKGHVLSPVRNAGVACRRWGLAVCPATELSTTKSGSQHDTLFVGVTGWFWVVGLLRTLHSRCAAPENSFFGGVQLQRYEQGFHDDSSTLGLQRLHAVPHSVRHAGPSEGAFHKRADLAAIQKRGRWGSPKSVVLYEKGAKLLRQLSFVPEHLLKKASSLEFQLPCRVADVFSGTSPALPTQ